MAVKEKETTSQKLGAFIEKNRKIIIGLLVVVVVAVVAVIAVISITSKVNEKALADVDAISFALTDGSSSLEEAELKARSDEAMAKLAPLTKKGGVGGVRANMLAAELAYNNKDYESAVTYWNAAASKGKKSYTAPLANYNKGVCYEQLGKNTEAAAAYKAAADYDGFILGTHAKFSYGRVLEATGDYAGAVKVYTELNDKNPDDSWANLAKSRILKLQVEGKAE